MNNNGATHWLKPIKDPYAPNAVPNIFDFTTKDTAGNKNEK
jgi:hypothetical protein